MLGASETNVQSAYSHATSLEEQFRQAGFPSSPIDVSVRTSSQRDDPTLSPAAATRQTSCARPPLAVWQVPNDRHVASSLVDGGGDAALWSRRSLQMRYGD